jgi:hypothetical protein
MSGVRFLFLLMRNIDDVFRDYKRKNRKISDILSGPTTSVVCGTLFLPLSIFSYCEEMIYGHE